MPERLKFHYEPERGWMNDPNGLVFFRGRYHAFFQHNPHGPVWGPMHWGHAVSDDLIHWEELPIALTPDRAYENSGGCFSGSAVVRDDRLYLFYTSVAGANVQTQSMAFSDDGIQFTKFEGNPLIAQPPAEGSRDFRDPKVLQWGDEYCMVIGSGKDKVGKILLYTSPDLLAWSYAGVLFEGAEYGPVLECPDLFKLGDKTVLMFSQTGMEQFATVMIVGEFDGRTFTPLSVHRPEAGPKFYAPQTFEDDRGRRLLIGWLYSWFTEPDEDGERTGALSLPREVTLVNAQPHLVPVEEAAALLTTADDLVRVDGGHIRVTNGDEVLFEHHGDAVRELLLLKDTRTLEGFVNGGELNFSVWYA